MLRLMHAGLVAAALQLGAAVAITLLVILPALDGITFQNLSSAPRTPEVIWNYASPLLIWSYLIVATGIAFTRGHFTVHTAEHIRAAFRERGDRKHALMQLLVCLSIPAIILASFALEPPPTFLAEAASHINCAAAASCIWAAAISIVVACLGATAHAVKRALDE